MVASLHDAVHNDPSELCLNSPAIALYLALTRSPRETLALVPTLALAGFPLLMVMLLWGGPVPPRFTYKLDMQAWLRVVGATFGVANLGFYALLLIALPQLRSIPTHFERIHSELGAGKSRWALPCSAIAFLAIALFLLPVGPDLRPHGLSQAGHLWRLGRNTPQIGASTLLFWVLVPAGAVFIWLSVKRLGLQHPITWMIPGFVLMGLVQNDAYQRYYDHLALLFVLLCAPLFGTQSRRLYLGALATLCVANFGFAAVGYFLSDIIRTP